MYKLVVPSLLLILMGSLDCLTTVIGTAYFGTYELNPIISGIVYSNIPAFVIIKLAVTFSVAFVFVRADKALLKLANSGSTSIELAQKFLRLAIAVVTIFLSIVVLNNILVLIQVIW